MLAHAYGCRCHIAMPDDAAEEKGCMLAALGKLSDTAAPLFPFCDPFRRRECSLCSLVEKGRTFTHISEAFAEHAL